MSGPGLFPPGLLAGSRYAVLGLGRNGAPAVRALAAMGADVQAWDDGDAARAAVADVPGVAIAPFDTLAGFDALVLSPGIPHILPHPHPVARMAHAAGVPILSDANLLFQAVRRSGSRARFAGITGTNGKSTTTTLLAHMLHTAGLPVAAGGNLGPAALALPLLPDTGVYVLEMSSYMLERLRDLRFDAACLLNLTPDHLDRHGDMAGYRRAKQHVFDRQGPGDLAVLGQYDAPDDAALARDLAARGIRVVTISGTRADAGLTGAGGVLRDADGPIATLADAPSLPGAHNAENAAAAAAMALALGVPRATIAGALRTFPGLAHRQKPVGTVDGVRFIDDSKATNADAASRALGCYDRLVWIAGGVAKAGGIADLAPFFPRVAHAFLIGQDAPALAETLAAHGVAFTLSGTMDAAVPAALALARRDGVPVVLLSPACASFDQYASFEHRGRHFADLVRLLAPTLGTD
ncbi:UDP-N-acetylmuramoylalanine/D-glutamate ligase [Gluconacetobacter diazotrophicus PA1 5]|uniref:UDP-N-acetylmuramoylalanine--D-glutamate ligase n=2 Tax=Gluconacetobacter diazotrophicus TaxID=33996 RepID=A9H0I3_GLUDA|nr:UDP-N-acetylmuramoyl-L-alanine--D-glutamate ligase [Gluconacetobacter diazotrophicus]ACI52902.1 UDP-N-acetylmuramoylalanine/D-glutamate ligase [Gluconacetobacter diazotrophicus PA1 5]MBB2157898.1 UDP-N-acetylmuramoyl-L-alanine--D-glutamate ligase [Gluconacetobacter diazotrophicus]TWB08953.1 UDP-N-acetylmuramoylalanine--D-glutamate ligase [Gluconacetobacter diazotrophicus]CAP57132.1 putative UDP-N-acetylmuramoylalanine--D-glutamate ligase [Gluconacetobacter diazotrophicus PA1 5]